MNRQNGAIACVAVAVLCWATVATAFKIALAQTSVYMMLTIASTVASIILALNVTFQHKWGEIRSISCRYILYCSFLGLINPVLYYYAIFAAYDLLPAHVALTVNYMWPILLTILLAVAGHQRIPVFKYFGMAISLFGLSIISIESSNGGEQLSITGFLLAVFSALLWAAYWLFNNRLKDCIDSTVSLFLEFSTGCIVLYLGLLFVPIETPLMSAILPCTYIGIMEMGLPFLMFALALRNTNNPALVNQLCYLAPFLSLFIIAIVLHENITLYTFLGLALIIAGILFNQYGATKLIKYISRR